MNLLRMSPRMKIPVAIMVAVALILALGGGALAARGALSGDLLGRGGIIYGCYVPHKNAGESQGKLRLVSDLDNCKTSEERISWVTGIDPVDSTDPTADPTPTAPVVDASELDLNGSVTGVVNPVSGAAAHLTEILFNVSLASGGPVDLTPGTAKIKLEYLDKSITSTTSSRFQTTPVSGAAVDSDLILELDEILQIRLLDFDTFLSPDLKEATRFTIEVFSESESVLSFEATTPASFLGTSPVTLSEVTPGP